MNKRWSGVEVSYNILAELVVKIRGKMKSYIQIFQERNKNKAKVITEKEFLEAEKSEKELEDTENIQNED